MGASLDFPKLKSLNRTYTRQARTKCSHLFLLNINFCVNDEFRNVRGKEKGHKWRIEA